MRKILIAATALFLITAPALAGEPVAKVGERVITIDDLNRALASMPNDPSAKEDPLTRNKRAIVMLRDLIDAELLYDDAVREGALRDREYMRMVDENADAVLADLYRYKIYDNKVKIDKKKVRELAGKNGLDFEAATAALRAEKRKKALKDESVRLFGKYNVQFSPVLAEREVAALKDSDLLVTSPAFRVDYGQIREPFSKFGSEKTDLLDFLANLVEVKLFAVEGRAVGLARDKRYSDRAVEFERATAVNIHRDRLNSGFAPSQKDIADYIAETGYLIHEPRFVSALMIVTPTKEETAKVRSLALAGGSFYDLAIEHSTAPGAKAKAGRIGGMTIGHAPYSTVDLAILALKPEQITEPIKGIHGWSIFKLLEISDPAPRDPNEAASIASAAIVDRRAEAYLDGLRKSGSVTFYRKGKTIQAQ
jgi:parvulin-like peptidyl-prolyl isomerase